MQQGRNIDKLWEIANLQLCLYSYLDASVLYMHANQQAFYMQSMFEPGTNPDPNGI